MDAGANYSARLSLDLGLEAAKKVTKSALLTAVIESDRSEKQWQYYGDTTLGFQFCVDLSGVHDQADLFAKLDVVFSQQDKNVFVLLNCNSTCAAAKNALEEIFAKTVIALETTLPQSETALSDVQNSGSMQEIL